MSSETCWQFRMELSWFCLSWLADRSTNPTAVPGRFQAHHKYMNEWKGLGNKTLNPKHKCMSTLPMLLPPRASLVTGGSQGQVEFYNRMFCPWDKGSSSFSLSCSAPFQGLASPEWIRSSKQNPVPQSMPYSFPLEPWNIFLDLLLHSFPKFWKLVPALQLGESKGGGSSTAGLTEGQETEWCSLTGLRRDLVKALAANSVERQMWGCLQKPTWGSCSHVICRTKGSGYSWQWTLILAPDLPQRQIACVLLNKSSTACYLLLNPSKTPSLSSLSFQPALLLTEARCYWRNTNKCIQ